MKLAIIGPEAERHLSWHGLARAFEAGHRAPRADVRDSFLYRGADTVLSRAAWIDGLGIAVKTATIFPENAGRGAPTINGLVTLFADDTGTPEAILDFHLVTKWKTAGDSVWAASRLARQDARRLLVVGAGSVARALIDAYRALFPAIEVAIWNRTAERAESLARETGSAVAEDLAHAVSEADIIATATMSTEPLIRGEWLRPGQHLDLIGAYRPDMREADDEALRRARIFVDSRATTIDHIGELKDPIARGVIRPEDIVADFYDADLFGRRASDEITLFKNGGGAHLDLMTARYILQAVRAAEET